MPLTSSVSASVNGSMSSVLDHGTVTLPFSISAGLSFANGTGANQADVMWSDQRTLGASASEDLDLAGSLTGMVGGIVTMAKIKAIFVKAAAANTNDVQLSQPAANGVPFMVAAGDGIKIKPGGALVWVAPNADGVPVTAGTGDLITLTNGAAGTSVTYDILVLGTSA